MYALMTSMQAELDYRRERITRDYELTQRRSHVALGRRWHRPRSQTHRSV